MANTIRVLIVEDSADNAELMLRALGDHGFAPQAERVETEAAYLCGLDAGPDVILADYRLPHFSGLRALELLNERRLDIPFIVVSGVVGDEEAAGLIKLGASDFLHKDRLARLGLAVTQALKLKRARDERRLMDEALVKSEQRFRTLSENSSDLVIVIDRRGVITYVSPSLKQIGGYEAGEALDQNVLEFIHPEDVPGFNTRLSSIIHDCGTRSITEELRFRRKDGSWLTLETIAKNALDDSGITGVVLNSRDISERKLAEERERLQVAAFNAAASAIVVTDREGAIQSANSAFTALTGYEIDEIVGRNPRALVRSGRQDESFYREMWRTILNGGVWRGDLVNRRKDGTFYDEEMSITPVRGKGGDIAHFIAVKTDVTERKKQEQKIARLNRIHAVMSGINSLIVRVRDRQELFNGACRIAVDHGSFGIAWIGVLNRETREITPAACAGVDAESFLARSQSTARPDAPMGQGVAGSAIRERRAVSSNDITTQPGVGGERRKEATRRGYHSSISLPLLTEGAAVGNFSLFAKEANFFTADEVKLLTELAGDISFALEYIAKEEKLNYLAYYDALTGLPNRALFDDRMTQVLRTASHEKNKTALVLIDLERFRVINDTLGRHIADGLLKLVAERLQSVIFDRDSLARVQGDIFAGLFPDIKDEADIARIVEEKIIGCLSQSFTIDGQELRVSAKIGVALFPSDATEPDALFSSAGAALRQAKDSSDRYLFYARKMNAQVAERLTLENKLQRALERDEFVLFYQPKVDLSTGRVAGLEALMRWNDSGTGLVPPMLFIPLLEETGMIVEVGAWAMKQAVSQYAAWQAAGLQPPPIAVNVSAVQLKCKDFVTSVQQAIAIAGKPDHGLDLEITESMIMEDIESSIGKLKMVRDLGVGISIDDFGTGHSSLRYLTRLPITALKIDRAFIQHMATNADDVAIVSTVIALGHNLNLKVIAEGVETEEQRKFLRLLKCDQFQGYLFSKPVPAEQVPALLTRTTIHD